ncbi:hypothetical protein MNV49_005405 [Pseudohyphozyma bogoriensis]|nr:hypothetical protein MNV49_005405 [Pseudohyphozyma bogoriensis]
MPPSKKRLRRADYEQYEESEDEWEADRQAAGTASTSRAFEQDDDGETSPDSEDDDDAGVAQFEDDDVGEDYFEEDQQAALGKEIASIPFTSLLKAKKKLARQQQQQRAAAGLDDSEEEDSDDEDGTTAKSRRGREISRLPGGVVGVKQGKRKNGSLMKADRSSKHAPMEMSSKKAVKRTRTIVESTINKARDPRFDSLSGSFKPDLFATSYSFLAKNQTSELEALRKTAAAARKNHMLPSDEKERIEGALQRMESREVSRKTKEREGEAMRSWKKEEKQKREGGKKEFWLKKSEQKQVFLKAKYDALSSDKKQLRKSVEKKRRKTAQKDKKLIPRERVQ